MEWLLGRPSSRVKRPKREADHSPQYSTEVEKGEAIPTLPRMSSRDSFPFYDFSRYVCDDLSESTEVNFVCLLICYLTTLRIKTL
jgi:hypothetical protein